MKQTACATGTSGFAEIYSVYSMSKLCAVCKKDAKQTCSACNWVYYCSKEHQKEDWKQHKKTCAPFKISTNETMGRYVVATRNIQPGEVIMKKLPLILGPKMVSVPLCLGCHKKLNLDQSVRYDCSKCRWPLCNESCEESPLHKGECAIFSKAGHTPTVKNDNNRQSVYSSIAPLRALLLKTKDPNKFETLINSQSHLQEHLATQVYQVLRRSLVPFFIDVLKIDTNEREILTICSIFDTNCFDVRDSDGLINVRGFYPTISFLSHDCKHNTKHVFRGDDFQLVLTSTVPIKRGDLITLTYTQTLWGTLARRAHLKMSKHFDCTCKRCKDTTELGSYAGAIYCTQCKAVDADSENKIISNDPLDQDADWKCEVCDYVVEGGDIVWMNQSLKKEISQLDKTSPEGLEGFLRKYRKILHPKNSHFLEVKYALSQMYGNLEGYKLEDLPVEDLGRKIELCRELLEVADILEPGLSGFRGSLLHDLQEVMVAKTERDLENGRMEQEAAEDILNEAKKILQEAEQILCSV